MGAAERMEEDPLWSEKGVWEDEIFELRKIPKKNVIKNGLFARQILSGIPDKGIIDETFVRLGTDILNIIDNERLCQGIEPYSDDQKIILLHELYRVRVRYFSVGKRKDGRDVFYSHLMGALRILVQEEGITGLASILAVINHDVIEDFVNESFIKIVEEQTRGYMEFYFKLLTVPLAEVLQDCDLNRAVERAIRLEQSFPLNVKRKLRRLAGRDVDRPIAELLALKPDEGKKNACHGAPFLSYAESIVASVVKKERAAVEEILAGGLVEWNFYRHKLSGFDESSARRIEAEVVAMGRGVTKIKMAEYDDTINATLVRIFEEVRRNVHTALIKLADNLHNANTFGGHGDMEKIKSKVRETEEIYLQMARVLHIRFVVRDMVDKCLLHLNPTLRDEYRALSDRRVAEWRDKPCAVAKGSVSCWDNIRTRLAKVRGRLKAVHVNIVDFKIIPTAVDNYASEVDKSFEEMRMADLNIPDGDPMFEILVLVKPGTRQGSDEDSRRAAISEATLLIEKEFGLEPGVERSAMERDKSDLDRYLGSTIEITDYQLGGTISFRVNDEVFEARSKRGILADFSEGERTQRYVEGLLTDVLNRIRKVGDAKTIAGREFLRPRITVYTPHAKPFEFPRGATGLDFANRVDTDFLIGLLAIVTQVRNADGSVIEHEVDPFAPLQRGQRYRLKSSIPDVDFDEELYSIVDGGLVLTRKKAGKVVVMASIMLDPGSLIFSQTSARSKIRSFFHSLGNNERGYEINEHIGRQYLNRLAVLYGLDETVLVAYLNKFFAVQLKKLKRPGCGDEALYIAIGRCEVDPFEGIIKLSEEKKEFLGKAVPSAIFEPSDPKAYPFNDPLRPGVVWDVEFRVPERAGGLDEFNKRFSKEVGIKITQIMDHVRGYGDDPGTLVYRFDLQDAGISIEDFFKHLLRICYKYGVRILKNDLIVRSSHSGAPDRS